MKRKGLLIATIFFFLIVNTSHFWESKIGIFLMLALPIIIAYFFVLLVLLLIQFYLVVVENLIDKQRIILIVVMIIVLITSRLSPNGVIFSAFESKDLLIAQYRGVASSTTTLKFKANHKFVERRIFFGIQDIFGEYIIKGDTIFFKNVSQEKNEEKFYEFAIIKRNDSNSNYLGEVIKYKNRTDTIGWGFDIIKNELINDK